MEAEKNRAAIWEVDRATGRVAHLRERICAIPTA